MIKPKLKKLLTMEVAKMADNLPTHWRDIIDDKKLVKTLLSTINKYQQDLLSNTLDRASLFLVEQSLKS